MSTEKTFTADEDVLHSLIMAYKENYSKEPWYKEPEINHRGHLSLSFKDEKTAIQFCEEQAKAGHVFIALDGHTGKIVGYSDGSGVFNRNTDNKSFKEIADELAEHSNRSRMR